MEAKELRVGNYISYRGEWACEILTVGNKFETHNKDLTDYLWGILCGSDDILDYSPIPLNNDLLWALGFSNGDEQTSNCYLWDKHWKGLFEIQKEGKEWLFDPFGFDNMVHIKYIHQLQNLYFALTGEELTLSNL